MGSTDFLQPVRKPTWLLYNPWDSAKTVRGPGGGEAIEIPANNVRLIM